MARFLGVLREVAVVVVVVRVGRKLRMEVGLVSLVLADKVGLNFLENTKQNDLIWWFPGSFKFFRPGSDGNNNLIPIFGKMRLCISITHL